MTPKFLVWIVLAMTLRRDLNYQKVLNWLVSGVRWASLDLPAKLLKDGAISHARVKLGYQVFHTIFQKLVDSLKHLEPDFHGFISVIFDGSNLTMPDTESNQKHFGRPKAGRGQAAFPQMRVVTLMVRSARIILDVAYAPFQGKGTGERTLMMEILQRVKRENLLFMFDAGFYSFFLLYVLHQQAQHFLMKVSSSVHLSPIAHGLLPDGSYLALIKGKVEDPVLSTLKRKRYKKVQLLVRVVEFQIPGFRPVRLISNIMDTHITARELVCYYHKRWDIEITYDEIKTHQCATLRGQCPTIFRSKRSDLVQQELYAMLITYNQIRLLIHQAAHKHGQDPLKISFLDALQWIIDAVEKMNGASEAKKKRRIDYLLKLIAESLIDRPRRHRVTPRVVKVKISKFAVKQKKHKSQQRNLENDIKIISPKDPEIGLLDAA